MSGPIVYSIIAIALILVIVFMVRGSGNPLSSRARSHAPINHSGTSTWCPIHKQSFGLIGATCPFCDTDYHNDVYAGVFPPGINESNKQFYYVEDWIVLRKIDMKWHNGEITEQEATRQRDEYIRNTIPKRIAVATGTDPDVQRAKMEANLKRRNNYAGSAQYSGITPK